ncbi:hypothetical protein DFH09DRAFT_1323222 [Mycena vulgaris]|nr:hypothetical protein DFH09DRAFT_1323222 [Mycena vulgaris]
MSPPSSPSSNQPPPRSSSPVPADATAAAKKAAQAAQARVSASLQDSLLKKRKTRVFACGSADDDPAEESTYRWYGRNLVRTCGPYERIHTIVLHGVKTETAETDDEAPPPTVKQQRLTESWEILKATIPNFGDDMIILAGDAQWILLKNVCNEIQKGLTGARSDDCGALRKDAPGYLLPVPPPPPPPVPVPGQAAAPPPQDAVPPAPDPPIPRRGSKAPRGWNHPVTAAALRPHKYPDTPETYQAIISADPRFPVLGTQLPTFMYAWQQIYNADDLDAGYLDGHLLRRSVKHVYQGPQQP